MRGKSKSPPCVALHVVFVSILSRKRPDSSRFAPRYRPTLSHLHGCSGKTRPTCWRFQRTTGSGAEDRRQRKMYAISTSMIKAALITDLRSGLCEYFPLTLLSARLFPVSGVKFPCSGTARRMGAKSPSVSIFKGKCAFRGVHRACASV